MYHVCASGTSCLYSSFCMSEFRERDQSLSQSLFLFPLQKPIFCTIRIVIFSITKVSLGLYMLQCTWSISSPISLPVVSSVGCTVGFTAFLSCLGYLKMLLCSWSLCCCSSWAWSLMASCSSSDCWLRPSISHCSLRAFFCQSNTPTHRDVSFSCLQYLKFDSYCAFWIHFPLSLPVPLSSASSQTFSLLPSLPFSCHRCISIQLAQLVSF